MLPSTPPPGSDNPVFPRHPAPGDLAWPCWSPHKVHYRQLCPMELKVTQVSLAVAVRAPSQSHPLHLLPLLSMSLNLACWAPRGPSPPPSRWARYLVNLLTKSSGRGRHALCTPVGRDLQPDLNTSATITWGMLYRSPVGSVLVPPPVYSLPGPNLAISSRAFLSETPLPLLAPSPCFPVSSVKDSCGPGNVGHSRCMSCGHC